MLVNYAMPCIHTQVCGSNTDAMHFMNASAGPKFSADLLQKVGTFTKTVFLLTVYTVCLILKARLAKPSVLII